MKNSNTQNKHKCSYCNKEFTSRKKAQKFCSISCSSKSSIPEKEQECEICKVKFTFKGRTRKKYCDKCRKKVSNQNSYRSLLKRGRIKTPGAGKGGNQFGENNHQWKGGKETYTKYKSNYRLRCFKVWDKRCVICDFAENIEVHHIDGNPHNYETYNLIPLCSCCHKKVHKSKKYTSQELEERLFCFWKNGRNKIAEKIGKAEKPIRGEGQP